MKRLLAKIIPGLLLLSGILLLITGCSSSNTLTATSVTSSPVSSNVTPNSTSITSPGTSINPTSTTSSGSIQTIADPIVKNILVSLNNNDYAGFSRDFSTKVKNLLNQTAFNQLHDQANSALGDFQSVLFVSSSVQNGTDVIVYVAHFSKEPAGVTVTLGLQSANGSYQVEGLNFYSPNLLGQPLDVQQIRSYADPETENVLVSLNNNDYTGFSKDFDPIMKNAVPESGFSKLYSQQKATVGDYQSSIEFESAASQNGVVTVRYLAKYSDEPSGVWVTISFDSNQKIAGLFFSSPKLAAVLSK